ncbi:MAG: leucine-rich repeat protein, partial [Peptostreptococcaceae bacterium]
MKKIILIITLLITLVACKSSNEIKIEFESNGSIVEIQYIKENSKVNKPIDPFKENYIFLYWELNNEEFDFNTLINEDIILKAKYKEDTHKVVFINDNVVLKEIDILHNNKVENIIINKEGYKFIGWLLNDEIFNFNTLINEDIILYALFEEEIVQYTVSFVIDEEINNILINKNNKVEQPIDPFKENYLFLYWELDNNEYDFNTLITKDIILIAKFIIKDPEIGTIYSDEFNNEYEVYDTNKLILNKVNENLEYINIPSELYGNTITKINNEVFLNNTIIKEIILPDTIEYIGNSILKGCTNLENLTIPFIGETISDNNFLGYFFGSSRYLDNIDYIEANLINVTITNIKELKRATFYQCNYIEKINLPNNLELIEEYAFYECYNLTNIIIPSEVVLIKASSFYHCTSLLTVTFNDDSKLEKIEEYAFSGCNSLLTIKLPDSVKEIERGIFYKCLN